MKKLFKKYKSVIRFVVLFLGVYILLSFLYSCYLSISKEYSYPPDYITNLVAKQSSNVLTAFGYPSEVYPTKGNYAIPLYVNRTYIADIVEGCNAVSIIILFIAFVIAFAQKLKKTLFFILAGSAIIYSVNILRISILTVALYKYPEQESILHGVIFPGIIYSMVFILWMLWVKSLKIKKEN